MAIEVENDIPDAKGRTKRQRFASLSFDISNLPQYHVWGCPVYILDAPLQIGQNIPQWNDRSRIGLYLGPSPNHATNVPMVRDLHTGHVSPQYHIIFDNTFSTLPAI